MNLSNKRTTLLCGCGLQELFAEKDPGMCRRFIIVVSPMRSDNNVINLHSYNTIVFAAYQNGQLYLEFV